MHSTEGTLSQTGNGVEKDCKRLHKAEKKILPTVNVYMGSIGIASTFVKGKNRN
jgi:hypothetical protein